ncbi:hypothetical protein H705_01016, partial [Bartonella bacilliformis Cond044]
FVNLIIYGGIYLMKRIVLVAALCSALSSVVAPVTVAHAKPQSQLTHITKNGKLLEFFVMPRPEFNVRYDRMKNRFKGYNFDCRDRITRIGIVRSGTGYVQCTTTKR